jgi:alpha-galactosidase
MKTLRFTVTGEQPDKNGIIPLADWTLDALLEIAGADADNDARAVFSATAIMFMPGGWQSWSPGWELAPGESNPASVRLIPQLRKLSAAPWDCTRNGNAPRKTKSCKGEADASFLMYLRAGSLYLVVASLMEEPGRPPVCFSVSKDRRRIRAGVYAPGNVPAYKNSGAAELCVAELCVFLANGYFDLKDKLKKIYARQDSFESLSFLGAGTAGVDFRPGGYASWYNHYTKIDEAVILADLEGLQKTDNLIALRYLKRGQPAVFQIDDGWEKAVGEWDIDRVKFPRGLKDIAARIENAGLIPGIWIAPFLVTKQSRIFHEKPHWLLKKNKRPVQAGWNPHWDGCYYCLDLSRDDVLDYLRSIMREAIDEWGFRYLKLDFMYAGFLSGDYTGRSAGMEQAAGSRGSAADYYEQAITLLTEQTTNAAGLPLAYLGCGLPLGSSYRHFPLSRIGTDTKESWDYTAARLLRHEGRPSALLCLRDTIGRSFMNGTIYINDPDVIFLRSANCALSETEKELIALVNFLLAGQILCSDDFFALGKDDLDFAGRINALYDELSGDEYGATHIAKDVYVLESRSGMVSGIINLSDKPFVFGETPDKSSVTNICSTARSAGNPATGAEHFSGGTWIVDHRAGGFSFAPRSISVYRAAILP